LNNSQIAQAAKLLAKGKKQVKIAQEFGVHESTISRALQTQTAKDIIEGIRDRIVRQAIPQAADNLTYAVNAYQTEGTSDQIREHGFKGSRDILAAVGIIPTHTQSVMIQQIINDTTNVAATPESLSLLARAMGLRQVESTADQVIDCQTVDNPVDNSTTLIGKP